MGNIRDVLFVDDDEDDYVLLSVMLGEIKGDRYDLCWASTYETGLAKLLAKEWSVILLDYDLGLKNGIDFLQEARRQGSRVPVVMVTGRGRYELDLEAMQAGASDYIPKNMLNAVFLERVIRYTLEHNHTERNLEDLVKERTTELQNALEELKVIEEELRTQNEELMLVGRNLQEEAAKDDRLHTYFQQGVVVTDLNGAILDLDSGACQLLGVDLPLAAGKLLSLFILADSRPEFFRRLVQLSGYDKSQTWTLAMQTGNASARPCCITGKWQPPDRFFDFPHLVWAIQSLD